MYTHSVQYGSSRESQRVAVAHFLFKVLGVLLAFPLVDYIIELMKLVTNSPGFQVANTHTFLNIIMAFLFLPFIQYIARLLEIIVPEKKNVANEIKPKYSGENLLASHGCSHWCVN